MIGEIIIILSVIAVMMLLSPMTISVNSARAEGKIDGFLSLGWIMFLFRYKLIDSQAEILILGRRVVLTHKKGTKELKEIEKHINVKKSRKMLHLENISYLSRPILRFIKNFIYSFRIKSLDIDITFGLKDPSHTGIVTGFLHSVPCSMKAAHTIRWTPDFTRPVLDWDMKAEAAITPILILLHVTRFIANRQVLRYVMQIARD